MIAHSTDIYIPPLYIMWFDRGTNAFPMPASIFQAGLMFEPTPLIEAVHHALGESTAYVLGNN